VFSVKRELNFNIVGEFQALKVSWSSTLRLEIFVDLV
jgi:hypothetical protein